jgi:Leucine-rich repeat (LRR) protein
MLLTTRGVESLKNLKTLDIRNNAIVDLQELQNLRNKMKVFGITTQLSNQTDTKYREIAQLGAAAGSDKRSLIIALRDILAVGDIERKSRDLALKRQICLDERGLRSLTALEGLENLETLSLAKNPDIKDWQELLSLPRLKLLRYSSSDNIPSDVLSSLKENGTELLVSP